MLEVIILKQSQVFAYSTKTFNSTFFQHQLGIGYFDISRDTYTSNSAVAESYSGRKEEIYVIIYYVDNVLKLLRLNHMK